MGTAVIRGLLFDKDGTLFDFRATWGAWSRRLLVNLAEEAGVVPEVLGRAVGYDVATGTFARDSAVIAHPVPEIAALLLPHLPGMAPDALVARMNALSAEAELVPAVPLPPLFERFRAMGLKIGLVTNDGEEPARAHLVWAGVERYFDFIAGFDSGHGAKPQPGPLLAFARAMGLDPSGVAMIGDSRHDLLAGRAAGMPTVAVLTGVADAAELASVADVVLPDIGHLPGWLATREAAPA
ncbi:HAD family hydrolase [Albidovulum sp.]|jgi:phosphoglycolate phosphatase|uniref:HAD family hydrolase n=1 Tax=Albidovulum sp. TaxID=1872424 RepID=UPI0025BC35A7|nr:HAD family hydrolase [Defluviimonas sp.]